MLQSAFLLVSLIHENQSEFFRIRWINEMSSTETKEGFSRGFGRFMSPWTVALRSVYWNGGIYVVGKEISLRAKSLPL